MTEHNNNNMRRRSDLLHQVTSYGTNTDTLHEIQAMLNAQDLKKPNQSFIDMCPEILQ